MWSLHKPFELHTLVFLCHVTQLQLVIIKYKFKMGLQHGEKLLSLSGALPTCQHCADSKTFLSQSLLKNFVENRTLIQKREFKA